MTARRIGLFGGTFDPPHLGHVAALRAAAHTGRFDRIEVTVAGDPYLKRDAGPVLPGELRLAMAHVAFDGLELVHVSDREIRRAGPSYTIDTVLELRGECDEVDLIVGGDLTSQLDSWHRAAELAALVRVGIVPRPGGAATLAPRWHAYEIPMSPVDLSSTFIRERLLSDEDLRQVLPAAVVPMYERFRE